jgi:hypothetical protein
MDLMLDDLLSEVEGAMQSSSPVKAGYVCMRSADAAMPR